MVDEDIVIGYILGYNGKPDKTIVGKNITKNGTYHAADDNADGFDPVIVNVRGLSQKDIDDLIQWLIDQLKPQLPDDTPELVPPEITADSGYKPIVDGADYPYLISASSDVGLHEVMYGVLVDTEYGPSKFYYVDLYSGSELIRHEFPLEVSGYGDPGNTSKLLSDGRVEVTSHYTDGTSKTEIWGPYLSYGAAVWAI